MLSDGEFEYIYKARGDRVPFAQVAVTTRMVTYLHSDLTGSIVASTDSNGKMLGQVDYSPYGESLDTTLSNFGYAGEWTDKTTGYSFLRARWLDTKTGNFLSEDPLIQITQNAFGYTEGDPLTQIDPLGLLTWGDAGKWIADAGRNTGKFILDHSTEIGFGLTVVGVILTATGVGAPIGVALAGAGSALSFSSGINNAIKGETEDAVFDFIGAIPGGAFVGSSIKLTSKVAKAENMVNKGVISTRAESIAVTRPTRTVKNTSDNIGIGMSNTGFITGGMKKAKTTC